MGEERLTDELLEQLLASASPEAYLAQSGIADRSFTDYLNALLDEKGLKKSVVIRDAGLDATYGYDCFSGKRVNPSRDYVIQLALGLRCTLLETQRLLRCAGRSPLWPKIPRDAIIIFGIEHGRTRSQVDDDLFRLRRETLVKAE